MCIRKHVSIASNIHHVSDLRTRTSVGEDLLPSREIHVGIYAFDEDCSLEQQKSQVKRFVETEM